MQSNVSSVVEFHQWWVKSRIFCIQLTNSCTVRCGPKMKYLYAGGNFHLTDHMKLQVQYCNILRKNIDLQRFCANCEQIIFLVSDTQKSLCTDARFYFYKKEFFLRNKLFLNFPACFYIPILFSNLNSNCSNLLDLRNLQEQVKKAFCYQKLFWPFFHCSNKLF